MSIQITVRNVPEATRDELAERARLRGQSMQEYLLGELQRLASRPSLDRWLEQVRERTEGSSVVISADDIVAQLEADRR